MVHQQTAGEAYQHGKEDSERQVIFLKMGIVRAYTIKNMHHKIMSNFLPAAEPCLSPFESFLNA